MGLVYVGIPQPFAESLCRAFGIDLFVETGVGGAGTTAWAVPRFRKVWSIELDPEQLRNARAKLGDPPNLALMLGESGERLHEVVPQLDGQTLFWLDAHWSGDGAGEGNECPLLAEIDAINRLAHEHVIMIDDARYMVKPPPRPFDWRQWPDLTRIIQALTAGGRDRYTIFIDDIFIAVTPRYKDWLIRTLRGA